MEEQYDHLEEASSEKEASSEEKPWSNNPSPEEIRSYLFNFLVTYSFLVFYLCRVPFGLFRGLFKDLMYVFLLLTIVGIVLRSEIEGRIKIMIISPTPTNMEFSDPGLEQVPCYTQSSPEGEMVILSNVLIIGLILLIYLLLLFPSLGLFTGLFVDLTSVFLLLTMVVIILRIEIQGRKKIKIINPTPTNMEFSDPRLEQEPCYTQSSEEEMVILFNVLIIGSILLFCLSLLFPLGLFRGVCNFLLFGFFSLTIIMIFIFADDPKKEASYLLSNKIDKDKRKPGDHIYTWRGGYAHHGICAKDGKVIHFVRGAGQGYGTVVGLDISNSSPSHSKDNIPKKKCKSCGDQSNLEGVISSCIECFLSRGDLYLFQYFVTPAFFFAKVSCGTCTASLSDPLEVVLNRAKVLHRTNSFGTYHILGNNCESFAYYCKTGLPFISGQVRSFYLAALFLPTQLPLNKTKFDVTIGVDFAFCCFSCYIMKKLSSYQPSNFPVERLRLWLLGGFGFIIFFTMMVCRPSLMHIVAYEM